ncbi:hypothetical protein HDU87_004991 [Geranomyces variabilis]|uniref:Uncharacterized protein n=1 Tax=Geranomyces variabilis TaxID=109894 RepID=A0AAD5XU54_9FUNG|nr:hypothetical protein HDU87_004991 [Geranomyces variabilis]
MHATSAFLALAGFAALTTGAAAQAAPPTCTVTVPADPLSAKGLATPYILGGGCTMANAGTQSFVEATILDPATGKLSSYQPLMITQGTTPAVAPVVPKLPANAIVGIWFGSNANTIVLKDTNGSLKQGNCVNGQGAASPFGQFAACNGAALMAAALTKAKIPALGKARDGTVCPTVRSFAVVDQDQSDNVNTQYLLVGTQTAQDTAANRKKFGKKGTPINNGSDNALLTAFLDPAIGCTPFLVPALDDPGVTRATLATDELQGTLQAAPVALVPANDPMVLVNGAQSLTKTNLYRKEVGQTLAANLGQASGKTYCQNFLKVAPPVIQAQKAMTIKGATPDPATGNNLFTFLGARFAKSFGADGLNCVGLLGVNSPITPVLDGNGVAIDLKFATNGGGATTTSKATATAKPTKTKGGKTTATAKPPVYHRTKGGKTTVVTQAPAPTTTKCPTTSKKHTTTTRKHY